MIRTLVVLAVAVAGALAMLWLLQRRMIYLPMVRQVPAASSVLPAAEEVVLQTADGLELGGWFLPGGRRALLVFNGNAGNRADRAPLAAALAERGFSVMLFDYRGYGENRGSPSEGGLALDARAALTHLASRPEVGPIAYYGESLGAGVAIELAGEHPPAALVLRSPFTSLSDVGRVHYPYLPVSLLLRDRYPSLERISRLEVPVLVVAGERDRVVPPHQSRRLYEAAPGPKRLLIVPGADHNDPALFADPALMDEVASFLDEWMREAD